MKKLLLVFIAAGAVSSCEPSDEGLAPQPALTPGRIVRYDVVVDAQLRSPRVRWVVELASALTVPGPNNQAYSQVKVFGLSDTPIYRMGTRLAFRYTVVPTAQQTPWKTRYEWLSVPAVPPGYTPNPEVQLTGVQAL